MAQNPKWCHSLSHWKKNYESWMNESVPETVMQISTFFDCRYLYGDETIIKELEVYLGKQLQQPMDKLFHFMAKNALQYEPPLTPLFKNIRTFKVDAKEVFDIKRAMTPIVDLVRVYAEEGFVLSLALPLARREDLDLARSGDELVVTVAGHRRVIALPSALRRCLVAGASLSEGRLAISFTPDPALWMKP